MFWINSLDVRSAFFLRVVFRNPFFGSEFLLFSSDIVMACFWGLGLLVLLPCFGLFFGEEIAAGFLGWWAFGFLSPSDSLPLLLPPPSLSSSSALGAGPGSPSFSSSRPPAGPRCAAPGLTSMHFFFFFLRSLCPGRRSLALSLSLSLYISLSLSLSVMHALLRQD